MRCSVLIMMLTLICAAISVSSANDLKVGMTTLAGASTVPGDTLRYVIRYDNDYIHSDSTSPSTDTAYITNYLPYGTVFLDTVFNRPDTNVARGPGGAWADGFRIEYLYKGSWLRHIPGGSSIASRDSLLQIMAVRYVIPPGIGEDSTGTNADNNSYENLTADDSLDNDAGYMSYAVRIGNAPAGALIVNGLYYGLAANAPGELSLVQGDSVAGVPGDSLRPADSIFVDQVFGFSSLESLYIDRSVLATNYDTIYVPYRLQNYGNATSDSFYFLAHIVDTSDAFGFTPADFDLCNDSIGADYLVGAATKDSAWWKFGLAQGSSETVLVRVVIPGVHNAFEQDTIRVAIQVRDRNGTGLDDAWPGMPDGTPQRVVIDTGGKYYHTHNDTLWDYGDTQYDTMVVAIAGAGIIRTGISYTTTGRQPGDTVTYTIQYENDASAATRDTLFVTNILPRGLTFLDTVMGNLDTGPDHDGSDRIRWYYQINNTWVDHMPVTRDSLLMVGGLRLAVPPGVGADNSGADLSDTRLSILPDGDSLDTDAGYAVFRTRIGPSTVPGYVVASAGSVIVNGWWDGISTTAHAPGQITMQLAGVISGIPYDSLKPGDSLHIRGAYAMSCLDSLHILPDTGRLQPLDTAYFRFIIQNQGNTTDSILAVAAVKDTAGNGYFSPALFCFVKDTAGMDTVVGLDFDTSRIDTAWYGFRLLQEEIDTFYLRIVLPGPGHAAPGDSLRFTVHVRDSLGSGGDDVWPGSTATAKPMVTVLDTFTVKHLVHLHGDTLWDYGDYQTITSFLTVGAVPPTTVDTVGTYVFDTTGVVLEVLSLSGTDTASVRVVTDTYPPDMHLLRTPLPRYYDISVGTMIDSITAVLTLAYTQEEFKASGLTDETGLYAVRYEGSGWDSLGSTVDTAANTVSCTTTVFSVWSIDGVCRSVGCPSCTVVYLSQPVTDAYAGTTYRYPVEITGGMVKQLVTAPDGMYFSGDTIYWTPEPADTGGHPVTLWSNGICRGDSQAFIITVHSEPETTAIREALVPDDLIVHVNTMAAGKTSITVRIPEKGPVTVSLYQADGMLLVQNAVQDAWKGCRLQLPGNIAGGIYLLKAETTDRTWNRKIVLLR